MLTALSPLASDDEAPKYVQVQRILREAVSRHEIGPQDVLPTERELAEELGVSRVTIRKAIGGLVEEGILLRRQGAGTFVASATARIEKSFSKISSFSEDMLARGRQPRSEWLSRSRGAVTPEEAINMGLSPGTAVLRFNRVRFADEMPMALEYSTIDANFLPSLEVVDASLYEALNVVGNRPVRALQRLRAIAFDEGRAELLQVQSGSPGLLIERRGFSKSGGILELTTSYYRGDAYDFISELSD